MKPGCPKCHGVDREQCDRCNGQGNLWCAYCGNWGSHSSGGCARFDIDRLIGEVDGRFTAENIPKVAGFAETLHHQQKFGFGDIVEIGELPESMSHFSRGVGIVVGWGAGGAYQTGYTLMLGSRSTSSWYHEDILTKIGVISAKAAFNLHNLERMIYEQHDEESTFKIEDQRSPELHGQ